MTFSEYSAMYRGLLILCAFFILIMAFGDQSLYLEEVRSLSELPLDKLIEIKSSLASGNDITDENENKDIEVSSKTSPLTLPMALPLSKSNKKLIRRYEDHYDEKGKDSKVSKIFQLAITALSFLAFGGYLLTLIITAIRRNTPNNGTGNVVILSVMVVYESAKSTEIKPPQAEHFNI